MSRNRYRPRRYSSGLLARIARTPSPCGWGIVVGAVLLCSAAIGFAWGGMEHARTDLARALALASLACLVVGFVGLTRGLWLLTREEDRIRKRAWRDRVDS